MVDPLMVNESLPTNEALALYAPAMERLVTPETIATPPPDQVPVVMDTVKRHGYWGPLPGETTDRYRALGVTGFKKYHLPNGDIARNFLLRHTSGAVSSGEYPQEGTREERLEEIVTQTKVSEVLHLACAAVAATMLAKGLLGDSKVTELGTSSAIVYGGIYPALLQRYNRLRTYRVLDRLRLVDRATDRTSA